MSVPALIPFDEHAKDALLRAFAEAQRLEAEIVGSQHVLLAGLGVTPGAVEAYLNVGTR